MVRKYDNKSLIGQKFGKLIVLGRLCSDKWGGSRWVCRCECGKIIQNTGAHLRSGTTKSCGCLLSESAIKRFTKHGQSLKIGSTPEYTAWGNMRNRCYAPATKNFKNWGGRGIKVCDRWNNPENGFINFFSDMGVRPSPRHSLDRYPNNDGDYEPGNCRWATEAEQKRNMSCNVWLEHDGERMILKDWARKLGLDDRRLSDKLKKYSFDDLFVNVNGGA